MHLTSNKICNIIGYKIRNREEIVIGSECVKCNSIKSKIAHKNKIAIIGCNKCSNRIVIVPKEYDDDTGDLIDYYVIPYSQYRKIIKNKDLTIILSREMLPEVKERIKLNYVLKELNK